MVWYIQDHRTSHNVVWLPIIFRCCHYEAADRLVHTRSPCITQCTVVADNNILMSVLRQPMVWYIQDPRPSHRAVWLLIIFQYCQRRGSRWSSASGADFKLAPSQWEMSLQSNTISHWLDTNLESALPYHWPFCTVQNKDNIVLGKLYQCWYQFNLDRAFMIYIYLINKTHSRHMSFCFYFD